jgi:hypothetical protein
MPEPYSAVGKKPDQILRDLEANEIAPTYKGSTPEYVQAALSVSVANAQRRWAIVSGIAACVSTVVAVAAVIVAATH